MLKLPYWASYLGRSYYNWLSLYRALNLWFVRICLNIEVLSFLHVTANR